MTEILTSEIEEAMLGKTRTASIPGQASSTAPSTDRVQLLGAIDVLSRAIQAWEMYAQFTEDLFLYDFAVQHIARMERELAALRKELACFSASSTS